MDDRTAERLEALAQRRAEVGDTRRLLTEETATAVREAHSGGATPTEIARRLRISRQAVYDFLGQ